MRALTITICLLVSLTLADVVGATTVIDGDTIEVRGQRIRLHGIDAPEGRQLCCLRKPGRRHLRRLGDYAVRGRLFRTTKRGLEVFFGESRHQM